MISALSSLTDVAFAICTALSEEGVVAVLTGGSAATYYAPEAYQSRDLDFVITIRGSGGAKALEKLGFQLKNGQYLHAKTSFTVDFPQGPLAIGEDPVKTWETVTCPLFLGHPLCESSG